MAPAPSAQILPIRALNLNYTQLLSLSLLLLVLFALKRRYITPIRDVPGPLFASFSDLWKLWHIPTGHIEKEIIALHKKHGMQLHYSFMTRGPIRPTSSDGPEVQLTLNSSPAGAFVRIAHNEVSVSDPDAVAQLLLPKLRKVSLPCDADMNQSSL